MTEPGPAPSTPSPARWRQIESTLQRALDVAPALRPAFLEQACAGDSELRREVESLIAASPATGFLERPVLAELGVPDGEGGAPAPDESRGDGAGAIAARLAAAVGDRYEIERELGRGGMAMVFLARDVRHRRQVAIKVLYPELSAVLGPDRFLKEIELTASLQHPHILPLHDSGSADGLLFYVMPYVGGENLRARLVRERHLPLDDAVRIAREVADALTYAHARGVVHRDIKPENILLQGDHALVADFGIALAVQHAGGERMTRTGLSLGTPQYMAPEQAMGDRIVDARADVYALGAVTYEMLAGETPFAGPSAQAIVARVLTEAAAPLAARRPNVAPHVERAVHTALEKIPADRFPSAAAFVAALTDPAATHTRTPSAAPSHRVERTSSRAPVTLRAPALLAAVVLATAALGATAGWVRGRAIAGAPGGVAPTPGVVRFEIAPDSLAPRIEAPAISPDGHTVVYSGGAPEGSNLFTRRLAELAVRPIEGTSGAELPFFSPDGAWVGYAARGAIWKVRLGGGAPELVTRLPASTRFGGASWGIDDVLLFSVSTGALFRVPSNGGAVTRVTVADTTLALIRPHLLPSGRSALVTVIREPDDTRVGVLDLTTGLVHEIGKGAGARYAAGHIVFARPDGELYRRRFDAELLRPLGDEEWTEGGVDRSVSHAATQEALFDVALDGTIVYLHGTSSDAETTRLVMTDRAGRERQVVPARVPWSPRLSPDGSRVAYGAFAPGRGASDLWITDLASGETQRLTADDSDSNDPRWSPDGWAIAFSANVDGMKDLFVQSLDATPARRLTRRDGSEWPSDWSRDGEVVLFTHWHGSDQRDIWIQPANGAAPRPFIATDAQETGAALSPDGRWVVYQSDETGRPEVYLQSFPVPGRKVLVSVGGGVNPMWRGDGRELFFWQEDVLLAVSVAGEAPGSPISLGSQVPLFRATYTPGELPMYDVSRDGKRFVLVTGAPRATRLVVATGLLGPGRR